MDTCMQSVHGVRKVVCSRAVFFGQKNALMVIKEGTPLSGINKIILDVI